MAGGGGIGMRTVWISLRAVNYTDQAFRQSIINIDKLTKAEKDEYNQLIKRLEVARLNIQTGVLYAAMTMMLAQRLGQLLSVTEVGSAYMSEFNSTLNELKVSFADTLFTALKPLLDVLQIFMNVLKDNAPLRTIVGYVALFAIGLLGLYSIYTILRGAMTQYQTNLALQSFLTQTAEKQNISLTASNNAVAMSFKSLAASLGIVVTAFMLFTAIKDYIGPVGAIIVAVVVAITAAIIALKAVSTFGATLGKDIAMVAASVAIGAGLSAGVMAIGGGFAKGTRSLPATGLFLGHKGERVYNPQTNRPAGLEDEAMGISRNNMRPQASTVQVNFNGDIHTRASIDDIDSVVSRKIYKAVKGST